MSLALTELQAITDDYWDKTAQDIYFEDSVMLYKLLGKGKIDIDQVSEGETVDGGLMIRVPLEYAPATTSTYGTTTVLSTTKATILQAARFGWAGYIASNILDIADKIQNNGKSAIVDLAFQKIRNIQTSLRDQMGTELYLSNGSGRQGGANADAMCGLADLFSTSTSTAYGSIAEADMADWKANVITTAEAISFPVLQKIRQTASIGQAISKKPDIYVTTEVLRDGYESTLQTQARYADKELLQAGFMNVKFGTAPVVADDKAASGTMYAMNLRFVKIRTHSDYAFTKPQWEVIVPTSPDKMIANSRWVGQLTTSNRKSHCMHSGLTLPA